MAKKQNRAHWIKQRRHADAKQQLTEIRSRAAFDKIKIATSDEGQHWQFYFEKRFLLSYWPVASKAKRVDRKTATQCKSPQQALRVAQQVRATFTTE